MLMMQTSVTLHPATAVLTTNPLCCFYAFEKFVIRGLFSATTHEAARPDSSAMEENSSTQDEKVTRR
jgi:hypothetical protein